MRIRICEVVGGMWIVAVTCLLSMCRRPVPRSRSPVLLIWVSLPSLCRCEVFRAWVGADTAGAARTRELVRLCQHRVCFLLTLTAPPSMSQDEEHHDTNDGKTTDDRASDYSNLGSLVGALNVFIVLVPRPRLRRVTSSVRNGSCDNTSTDDARHNGH